MPLTDKAYYDGKDWPRCEATPDEADLKTLYPHGIFECALPAGHEDFGAPRLQPHSWVQTGEK
jgi:hypothetical protein